MFTNIQINLKHCTQLHINRARDWYTNVYKLCVIYLIINKLFIIVEFNYDIPNLLLANIF